MTVEQQLSNPLGVMIVDVAEGVLLNVGIMQPEFAFLQAAKCVGDLRLAGANRLNLGAAKLDAGLEALLDRKIPQSLRIANLVMARGVFFRGAQFSPDSKLIFSSMISRRATSSGDSFSSDSTNGRLPRLSCLTRRETTLISTLGSWILARACLM
jgi:hypothetical protein